MRVCFTGFDAPIVVDNSAVSVLEIHNRALFTRVCQSLASGLGAGAVEPYSLWGEDGEIKPGAQFLLVSNPIDLPWEDKALAAGLASRFERSMLEDEGTRRSIEELFASLQSKLAQVALEFDSDYAFGINWELKRYLRTFGFGVDIANGEPLIDKLIKFLMLAKDASLPKTLLFLNLKIFLTNNEIDLFFEQAFFTRLSILMLENVPDCCRYDHERKYAIDQDLLESW